MRVSRQKQNKDAVRPPAPEGFTLIELMVSMALLSLLIVVLMGMVDSATKIWRVNENRVESYREARAAMNLIASDLRSAFASTNLKYFKTNAASSFGASPDDGAIFFLSSLPLSAQDESSSLSEICEVGYYLRYGKGDLSTAKQEGYSLYRYFRESNGTFTNLIADTGFFNHSPTNVEVLARNIPFFKVQCYDIDTNGTITPWVQAAGSPMPNFVEIQMTVYNNDVIRRLGSNDWKDTNSRIFRENSRVFTERIPLRQPE